MVDRAVLPRVAVVGGGIAGVACAVQLHAAGVEVVVLDRGHRLGGRMATRTMRGTGLPYDGRVVDVGAAYLTVTDDAFADVVSAWAARGLVVPWTDTFRVSEPGGVSSTTVGPVRYAAPHGLRGLVEDLAAHLPVVVQPRDVADVVRTASGATVDGEAFDAVVLAMPGPQALDVLSESDPACRAFDGQRWDPVVTLVAAYERRCWPEFDGLFVNDSAVLAFVADDGRRRGDGAPVLVAHASPFFASTRLDDPFAAEPALVDALGEVVGATERPVWTDVRRWSLARVRAAHPEPHWFDGTVGLCGDAWGEVSRIEAAWLSGTSLGRAMTSRVLPA